MKKRYFLLILLLILWGCLEGQKNTPEQQTITDEVVQRGYLNHTFTLPQPDATLLTETLPAGLSWDEEAGVLSGVPEEQGIFTIRFQKNSKVISYRITIGEKPLWQMVINHWIDLTQQEGVTTASVGDKIEFPKPFFTLYNRGVKTLFLCNGYLKGASACASDDLTNYKDGSAEDPVLIFFGDAALSYRNRGDIQYKMVGDAPRRVLVITYSDFHRNSDADALHNVQILIHEYSGVVQYLYGINRMGQQYGDAHLGGEAIIGAGGGGDVDLFSRDEASIFPGGNLILQPEGDQKGAYRYRLTRFQGAQYRNLIYGGTALPLCSDSLECTTGICLDGVCESARLTEKLYHNGSEVIELPFSLSFGGTSYTRLTVYEDGWIAPGDGRDEQISGDAGIDSLNDLPVVRGLFPLFGDIDLTRGGDVLYRVSGEQPRRKAVVAFQGVPVYKDQKYGFCSVEVVVDEWSGAISYIYGEQNGEICGGAGIIAGLKGGSGVSLTDIKRDQYGIQSGLILNYYPYNKQGQNYLASGINTVHGGYSQGIGGSFALDQSVFWRSLGDGSETNHSYTISVAPKRWLDTSGGTSFTICNGCHYPVETEDIFQVWGEKRKHFVLDGNGAILLNVDDQPHHPVDLALWGGNGGIFPLWGRYRPGSGAVEYDTIDDNGERYFVVTWHLEDLSEGEENHFQAQIGTSGKIYFCYNNINATDKVEGIQRDPGYWAGGSMEEITPESDSCILYQPDQKVLSSGDEVIFGEESGVSIPIGFTYYFNNTPFTHLYISKNGLIIPRSDGERPDFNMVPPVEMDQINRDEIIVAPLWGLLQPKSGGAVRYRVEGDISARRVIISYQNYTHQQYSNESLNMEVIFHEQSEELLFCYGKLSPGITTHGVTGISLPGEGSATLQQRGYNTLKSHHCYRYYPERFNGTFQAIRLKDQKRYSFNDLKNQGELLYSGSDPITLSLGEDGINYPLNIGGKELVSLTINPDGEISAGADLNLKPMNWKRNSEEKQQTISREQDHLWMLAENGSLLLKFDQRQRGMVKKVFLETPLTAIKVVENGNIWGINRTRDRVYRLNPSGEISCALTVADGCYPVAIDGDYGQVWIGCGGRERQAPGGWLYNISYSTLTGNCTIEDHGGDGGALINYEGLSTGSILLTDQKKLWIFPGGEGDHILGRVDLNLERSDENFYQSYRIYNPDSVMKSSYTLSADDQNSGLPFRITGGVSDGGTIRGMVKHETPSRVGMISMKEVDQAIQITTHNLFSSEEITTGGDIMIGTDEIWAGYPDDGRIARFSKSGVIEDMIYRDKPISGIGMMDDTLWIALENGILEGVNPSGILTDRFEYPFTLTLSSAHLLPPLEEEEPHQVMVSVVTGTPDQFDRCSRKLVIQWRNHLLNQYGDMGVVIDSGYYLDHCSGDHPVVTAYPDTGAIEYHYALLSGDTGALYFQVGDENFQIDAQTPGLFSSGGGFRFFQW